MKQGGERRYDVPRDAAGDRRGADAREIRWDDVAQAYR